MNKNKSKTESIQILKVFLETCVIRNGNFKARIQPKSRVFTLCDSLDTRV